MGAPDPKAGELTPVPAYIAHFEKDTPLPRDWAARKVNLVHLSEIPGGGHFGAMQIPEAFARDVRLMLER
jgi:microsomal epoxide hydrolase